MWVVFALISSFLLGVYDIFKKISLRENLVISVLYISSFVGALVFIVLLALSNIFPSFENYPNLYIPPQDFETHVLLFGKAVLVGSSWLFAYFALKHLPVTMVSAIRSSSPVWTLIGAIIIFNEQLNVYQWIGLIVTVFFYYLYGLAGQKEGIKIKGNKWIFFAITATLLGSISALFDKYLVANYNRMAVQAWFAIYMPVFLLPFLLLEKKYISLKNTTFKWRWSIPMIGLSLVLADFVYFLALAQPGSMISMVSALRRTSVVFTFLMAGMILKEQNIGLKLLVLLGILTGIGLIIFGSAK
jgi:transporter family protein